MPAARVFYISLVFSNDHRVLSQCNTRLRLLYLLNIQCSTNDPASSIHCSFNCHHFQRLSNYLPNIDAAWFPGSFSSASLGHWEKDPDCSLSCDHLGCDINISTRVETIRITFVDLNWTERKLIAGHCYMYINHTRVITPLKFSSPSHRTDKIYLNIYPAYRSITLILISAIWFTIKEVKVFLCFMLLNEPHSTLFTKQNTVLLTTLQNIIILTNAKELELYFNICLVNINLHKPDVHEHVDEIYSAGSTEHFKSNAHQNTWETCSLIVLKLLKNPPNYAS